MELRLLLRSTVQYNCWMLQKRVLCQLAKETNKCSATVIKHFTISKECWVSSRSTEIPILWPLQKVISCGKCNLKCQGSSCFCWSEISSKKILNLIKDLRPYTTIHILQFPSSDLGRKNLNTIWNVIWIESYSLGSCISTWTSKLDLSRIWCTIQLKTLASSTTS